MKNIKLSREQLYDLVWTESLLSLSKKYDISDVGLRKICIRMAIPIPKAGHWQKIKAEKRTPLKRLKKSDTYRREIYLSLLEPEDENPKRLRVLFSVLKKEIENDPRLQLIVSPKLVAPDESIIAVKENLESKEFDSPKEMIFSSRNQLDISVTQKNIGRALRFMDTLIKLLRTRGHDIKIERVRTFAIVLGEKIEIRFVERLKKIKLNGEWQHNEFVPSGILTFKAKLPFNESEWRDKKFPLENQLSKILAKLEVMAKSHIEEKLIWKKNNEIQQEKERGLREHKQKQEKELNDFKSLLQIAERWKQTASLRSYIDTLEAKALEKNSFSEEFKNWIAWARKKIDWFDPLIESEDELLAGIDRETLMTKKKPNSQSTLWDYFSINSSAYYNR